MFRKTARNAVIGILILIGIYIEAWLMGIHLPGTVPDQVVDTSQKDSDKRFSGARLGAYKVKAAMRDPDSFKLDQIVVTDDGNMACMKYHSKNGFGGYNTGYAIFSVLLGIITSDTKGFADLWKLSCTGELYDETKLVVFALENGY